MRKLFIVLIMLVAICVNAQWVQTNGPNVVGVKSLHAYGTNLFAGTSSGAYKSTNNGNTWTSLGLENLTVWGFASSGIYLFAGTSDYGAFRSTDNGTTWEQYNTGLSHFSAYAFASNQQNIYAATIWGGVYWSNSYGTQWLPKNNGLQNQGVICIACSGWRTAVGTIDGGVFFEGDPWYSRNNGLPINYGINTISYLGSNMFVGTGGAGIYISTNYGINWTSVNNGLTNLDIYSFAVYESNIFAGSSTGEVFMSTNLGTNWIKKNEGFSPGPSIRAIVAPNNYIFLGRDNYVWKRLVSEIINVENISTEIPSSYSLGQNYPNPFNPMTNVQFSMCNAGNAKIVVYDIQGREVQTLVNEKLNAGTYEVKFDGSELTSGVYFYKLITEGFTETKRMLLIK